jgi:hypothetical protein
MSVLTHDYLNICNDRKRILFINEAVCCSSEDNIRNQLGLLIHTMVLSDWYSNSKVVVLKIRANILISQDYIKSDYGILRVFCTLEEHIHIDMLDSL